TMTTECSSLIGVHRTWTLRYHAMPVGPQYSSEFGKMSGSVNGLQYWPAPNCPSSPHAWRRRNVVCPSSTPVPNSSNSKIVFKSPCEVGGEDLKPRRLWRTPANVLLSSPNSSSTFGSLVNRRVSYQLGLICLKSWPMSTIAKP